MNYFQGANKSVIVVFYMESFAQCLLLKNLKEILVN